MTRTHRIIAALALTAATAGGIAGGVVTAFTASGAPAAAASSGPGTLYRG